jgi:hypothetical protein
MTSAMGDIINQLDRLEEIMWALTAKVGDVDQQQQAFNIALIHLEQGRSADALPPPTADSANSGAATTPSHRRHLGQWSWPSASSPPAAIGAKTQRMISMVSPSKHRTRSSFQSLMAPRILCCG